jgi:ATP synthase protein I
MGDDLNDRIAKAQAELDAQKRPSLRSTGKGAGLGLRMASDFVAAILVGAAVGWGVDALFGWSPWGLIVCLVLGFIAGVRMIVRAANEAGKTAASGGTKDEGDGA